jgi:hypothetical protein
VVARPAWGPLPLSISLHEISRIDPLVGVVESIMAATASAYSVPLRTVWGNIASATNSAAQMIAHNRPDLACRACDVADAILADPRVEGGRLRSGSSFRRTSCCLIYQLDREARSFWGVWVLQPAATGRLGPCGGRCLVEPGGQAATRVEHVALSDLPGARCIAGGEC